MIKANSFKKSIGNVYKTEAILSRSQCVNNNNVAHSNHSGLNINDGGLWTVAISLQFAESVPVVCCEYSWQVPVPCWSQIIASIQAAFNIWWFMNAKLFTCCREICRQCYEFNKPGHMCAYSAILRLKIINNQSIEAIELSKIPSDIWGRVALREIIPRTAFGRGDVVQQPPISRSYLGYWAYRIYISERSDRYGYIYIYLFFLGRGQQITGETLFFSHHFYFPQSPLLKNTCILLLMKPAFSFWTYFLFKHLFGFP